MVALEALGLPSSFLKWSQIWDVFLLLDLEGEFSLLLVLLFVLEVVTGTETGTKMGKELGSELEEFGSFVVGSSQLSIWN